MPISEDEITNLKASASEMEAAVAVANSEFHRVILDAAMSRRLAAITALVVEISLILCPLAAYHAVVRPGVGPGSARSGLTDYTAANLFEVQYLAEVE